MAECIIALQAEKDIDEILVHIATDNLDAALAFNDRLTKIFEMLVDNSTIGRERPDLREGLRSVPEGNYIVFYRIWAGNIAIVRVLHGARDLDEIFG